MSSQEGLINAFRSVYMGDPEFVVRAPGRVNLIGEHTDYNDGFVFPAAIDYDVAIAGRARPDRKVQLRSILYGENSAFSLDAISRAHEARWSNYVRGVAAVLQAEGHSLRGMDAVIRGTVPVSSGLSSSAAMEVASCLAFEAAAGFSLVPVQRALLSQRAEREFVGVQCGIMDQFISALGVQDHALFIDTRSLDYRPVPLPATGVSIVIANTNKQRGLVDSEYNTRRAECEEAVAALQRHLPDVKALRDVTSADLARHSHDLRDVVHRRARHVVTEDERVLQGIDALCDGDIATFGRLMDASHSSLRYDYEVSCFELDAMVSAALEVDGVYGSRMTGAGFGGCIVSLVRSDAVDAFRATVASRYKEATGRDATFYVCRASDGASRVL